MPIKLQISHPDRMVVGIVHGTVTAQDLDGFVLGLAAEHAFGYRKIIDVLGAAGLTAEDLAAFSQRLHEAPLPPERGPIALVADAQFSPLARLFAQLMGDDRPVEAFRSLHAARQWLDAHSKIP